MGKILIAIPTLDYIHRKFVESLSEMIRHIGYMGVNFDLAFEGCTLVYISRDNLAKKAIEGDYSWVLWLDADMVFEKDIYEKLLYSHKDFVTALYRGRHGTHRPCIFEKLEPPERWDSFDFPEEPTIREIKGCGFGCVLTSTDILDKVWNRFGTCFRPTPLLGEDLAFCKRVSDCGFPMYASMETKVGHIGQYVIGCGENENGSILTLI